MKGINKKITIILALSVFLLAGLVTIAQAGEKEEFTARVVAWATPGPTRTFTLTMVVEKWTTDEERQKLVQVLQEGGSDALLKEMRKMEVGYLHAPQTLRWRLNIASSFQTDEGRVIRLVTERPVSFGEATAPSRSRDYEFGVIQFTLDEEGKGEGALIPTAKVYFDKEGKLNIEALGTGPQKLTSVKSKKKK